MAGFKESAGWRGRLHKYMMFALLMLAVLAVGCTVGGTLAWMVSTSEPIVNTFTYGDINITLTETDSKLDEDANEATNTYMMAPGLYIAKDPVITVKKGSEACWLFVKLDKSENFYTFMEYSLADGWTQLTGMDGVFFRKVAAPEEDVEYGVLKDDKVTVKSGVTADQLNALGTDEAPYPTLDITAYAVQYMGFEPEEGQEDNAAALAAWNAIGNTDNGSGISNNTSAAANSTNAVSDIRRPRFDWGDSIFTIE